MATQNTNQDPEAAIENAIGRTEAFLQKNGKLLLSLLAVIVVVVGGYFGYKYLYVAHRAEKAGAMMFVAEQQFQIDSFALALNGDGNNAGFLDVIERYGSTPQGNIANHYAGICYLKLGELDNALKYLGRYEAVDGAPSSIINAQNAGLQGDILVQKGEYEKAIAKYNKAIEEGDNSFSAPYYLKKVGLVYGKLGKNAEAVKAFQRIVDEYPSSMEARDVEKYIGMYEQK